MLFTSGLNLVYLKKYGLLKNKNHPRIQSLTSIINS
jgi:hypothetical protein